jgi:hypothetical protein
MSRFVDLDVKTGGQYVQLLQAVSQLSGLFSQSAVPYINYRVAENIFCRAFNANNLSRSDTAFDASLNKLGIGIKTFIISGSGSVEKVAEFNQLSTELARYTGKELALKLAGFRNERIELAKRTYGIDDSQYHVIGRSDGRLILFEDEYGSIDTENIQSIKSSNAGISFDDGKNHYGFNKSKSTLFKRFSVPDSAFLVDVEILSDPFDILLQMFNQQGGFRRDPMLTKGVDYVILPLYSVRGKTRQVQEKSGLNQWNAGGRARDYGEVYIPIPMQIHHLAPDFFPGRDVEFELTVPTGETLRAKVCQDNSKALMTNPNKDLSQWLLRKVLKLKEGELATIKKLDKLGFDSVYVQKTGTRSYKIDIAKTGSYEGFL